jgi:glutamate dehydrogenase
LTIRIDELFLDNPTPSKAYRLETFRSSGAISSTISQQLRCYFVSRCAFPSSGPQKNEQGETDIRSVSDSNFLEKASDNTLDIYQAVLNEVDRRDGPVIEMFEVEDSRERRVVIGFKMGGTQKFFSALSDLYHFYGLYSARKYVEQFANGITIISMYLNPVPNTRAPPIEHSIHQVVREASLLYCLPDNPFFSAVDEDNLHAVQEATYAYVGWIFAQHFCNRLGPAYLALKNVLDDSNPDHAEVLNKIKTRFREETFTRESIREVIQAHPDLVRMLYINFAMTHYPAAEEASQLTPTLSFQRLKTEQPLTDEELYAKIRKGASNQHAFQILEALLVFNKHVLKCNFYQPTKVALSFRLDPSFLPDIEYPKKPFGMFFVVGSDFRGFHVRFRDVARGGIRIIRSRGKENYNTNVRTLFDENYALSATQNLKNKDIPEGGAKGTILPTLDADYPKCFEKYVDSIIDLLLPGQSPGIKGPIVDVSGRTEPEILFFGPDENTAELMDWAANHARARSAPWWKSFTTGKSAEALGGIPHDTYGMTSLSVRQYIYGVLKAHGLAEKDVTKFQTGGPDGDLGSNEILLSKDKTVAIIDGSGVLHDPHGLDRSELVRLAKARKPISHFDKAKLGPEGYQVLVEDQDYQLPSGEIIPDGTDFRNNFHFRVKADLFVPCGGRPEAVNISNVAKLVDADGKPHFKYVVEGANLFFTQQARFWLEKRGVVLYKDSSTNKGGVTSSSLEVLAGMGLNDEEYIENMIFKDGKSSAFYQSYVKDIQQKICENAAHEYACIAKEWNRQKGTKARTTISDLLSSTLNDLQNELEVSDLYDNVSSRKHVLARAIPKTLVDKVGLDTLMQRLPEQYQRAIWSAWVSSNYIYSCSMQASNVDFFHFFSKLASQ